MPSNPIQYEEEAGRLRISWNNRRARKDWFTICWCLVCWIFMVPFTCVSTVGIFKADWPLLLVPISLVCWLVLAVIPLSLMSALRSEWIEINARGISWKASGWPGSKPKIVSLDQIAELALGYYVDREDERQSGVILIIYGIKKMFLPAPCHVLAYWLAKKHKEEIFERIREFVVRQSLPLPVTIYGQGRLTDISNPSAP